jgi:hypothetical protein
MSLDRFIHFNEKQPTQEEVKILIRSFLGEWPSEIEWATSRFFITVPGKPGTISVPGELDARDNSKHSFYREERWIEVWIGEKNIDVLTREQDPLVCAIATGLAKFLAHRLRGQLEKGH